MLFQVTLHHAPNCDPEFLLHHPKKWGFRMTTTTTKSMTVQLGEKIRSRRKQLGLTQEQLAEMLGVRHSGIIPH